MSSRWLSPARMRAAEKKRDHARCDGVAIYIVRAARHHGIAPATLHKLIHGPRPIPELLRSVIREAIKDGKRHRVEPYYALLEAAWLEVRDMPLTNGLILQAVIADQDEDVARDAFLLNRSEATRRQWKRHIELERSTKLDLWHALEGGRT